MIRPTFCENARSVHPDAAQSKPTEVVFMEDPTDSIVTPFGSVERHHLPEWPGKRAPDRPHYSQSEHRVKGRALARQNESFQMPEAEEG